MKPAQSLMKFPLGGLDQSKAFRSQPAYPGEVYTTADALNCRDYEWATDRGRGGSRPGLSKYYRAKTHDPSILPPYSIQDINQMYLAYIPPAGLFSYWTRARIETAGSAINTRLGATHEVYDDIGPYTFACSCWDHREGVAYIGELDPDETPATLIYRANPRRSGTDWQESFLESAERITGMVIIGEMLYIGWYHPAASPVNRIYRKNKVTGISPDGDDPWITSDDYAGLVFSEVSVNVMAAIGPLLGVQTASSTGRFSIWNTDRPTVLTPIITTVSQGTYSNARSCKTDSDEIEFFYTAAPVTGGNVQKIKTDGTIIWSYTPPSDDVVISYDKPGNRVCVLNRDAGTLVTVNCDTGLLKDTVASSSLGSSTSWRDLCTDWNGNLILWANSVAVDDVIAVDASYNEIWNVTMADAVHEGAAALRGRLVTTRTRALVVSGGRVHTFDRDGPTQVTIWPNALDPNVPYVLSAQNGPYMYYADGGGYRRYNPQTDEMEIWSASAGSMPVDDAGRSARLIVTWNGRTCLSGFLGDPQNIYMSAKDNPRDWDYAPAFTVPTQAVALNASYAGLIGDKVTALIPHSDDVLVIGCDGSIWQLTGDPMVGGSIDNISRSTGMAFGKAWCLDPDKVIYFFASRGGVFTLVPGGKPQRISDAISDRLYSVDVGEDRTVIKMSWDDRAQGLHLFITPLTPTAEAIHYFYSKRHSAWWPVKYASPKQNPKCSHAFDGDDASDRIILIGSWDSHVRAVDTETGLDDGLQFESYVALGPIVAPDGGELRLDEIQAMLGQDSGDVEYYIVSANDPQAALESVTKTFPGDWSGAKRSGEWTGGRGPTANTRVAGHAMYVYVRGLSRWALEAVRVKLVHLGWTRGRGF